MQRPFLSKHGFTLSELLLASGIMAFVLVGLLQLFITCIVLNESNRNLSVATAHGQYVLEEMKNTNFTSLKNGTLDWDWDTNQIGEKGLTPLSSELIVTGIVDSGYLQITVTLTWKDFGIRDRSLVLRTLITEP